MENIPRYHSNCTAVSRRTPQAHNKPYAFTQQSRMSSTETRKQHTIVHAVFVLLISSEATNYGRFQAASTDGTLIPTPHSLHGAHYRNSPRQRFYMVYYIIPCLDLSIYMRKFPLIFQCFRCFSAFPASKLVSCRKSSWAVPRGKRSHADIYTVRYAI